MNDIIDELESVVAETDYATSNRLKDLCSRASAEIKSLRTALESVTIVAGRASVEGLTFKDIKRGRVMVNQDGSAMEGN